MHGNPVRAALHHISDRYHGKWDALRKRGLGKTAPGYHQRLLESANEAIQRERELCASRCAPLNEALKRTRQQRSALSGITELWKEVDKRSFAAVPLFGIATYRSFNPWAYWSFHLLVGLVEWYEFRVIIQTHIEHSLWGSYAEALIPACFIAINIHYLGVSAKPLKGWEFIKRLLRTRATALLVLGSLIRAWDILNGIPLVERIIDAAVSGVTFGLLGLIVFAGLTKMAANYHADEEQQKPVDYLITDQHAAAQRLALYGAVDRALKAEEQRIVAEISQVTSRSQNRIAAQKAYFRGRLASYRLPFLRKFKDEQLPAWVDTLNSDDLSPTDAHDTHYLPPWTLP